jgi:beta-mannosidase
MRVIDLNEGWSVLQDVHDHGEQLAIYRVGWDSQATEPAFSEWEPIPRLAHLQLLLAETPYWGRELRHFNEHPWWYRLEFEAPPEAEDSHATLRFEGADYFCRVWLNGQLMGEHEGYFAPFEFEVGQALERRGRNLLIVKVWSPWDKENLPGKEDGRCWSAIRDMVKGTYEHADTFVQRDVNPVGLWGKVSLRLYASVRLSGRPLVEAVPASDGQAAAVTVSCPLFAAGPQRAVSVRCTIREDDTGLEAAAAEQSAMLPAGQTRLDLQLQIPNPRLWQTWDRGEPHLYRAEVELGVGGVCSERTVERFGVRTIELARNSSELVYRLNGQRIYWRGTAYFPDVYLSALGRDRYARDLACIRQAGCNAVRVHVHVENPAFYDLGDEMGIAIIQDADLNWVHPTDRSWAQRAVAVFGDMVRLLRNHPSIVTWICTNEPHGDAGGAILRQSPGPQLVAEARRLDPSRPVIAGSGCPDDPESGDSHNYAGSLNGAGTHYTDIYGQTEKLNTEFGFDAPPAPERLQQVPRVHERLRPILGGIGAIQYYQYRLLKYFIEHYRILKYRPCSGHFQFMFIDLCPQSFYGVYDWWGVPKPGLRALLESNQPLGVFMEHRDGPVAIWAVNDLLTAFPDSTVSWVAQSEDGSVVSAGQVRVDLSADAALRVSDFSFTVEAGSSYRVRLAIHDAQGRLLAGNTYEDPFRHPAHPQGHPRRMSHELGMRLYWA